MSRLALLRTTAPPTERPAATAMRTCPSSFGAASNTTSGCGKDFPDCRTRSKSDDRVRRNPRFTFSPFLGRHQKLHQPRRETRDSIESSPIGGRPLPYLPANPLGMIIHGYGQAAAATQTASLENLTAISGSHALAKTMDPQAAVDMGLIRSFGRHARSLSLGNSALSHRAGEAKRRCRPFVSLTLELSRCERLSVDRRKRIIP
jgi:hypothetical protein